MYLKNSILPQVEVNNSLNCKTIKITLKKSKIKKKNVEIE